MKHRRRRLKSYLRISAPTNTYLMKSECICTFKNQKFDIVLATLYSIDYYEDETRTKWIFKDAITR